MQPPSSFTAGASSAPALGSLGSSASAGFSAPPSTPSVDAATLSNAALAGALTTYLKHHELPLVGADAVTRPDGTREVVLYGFTATNYGKSDAVRKTRLFLDDPSIAITNRIIVQPSLAQARPRQQSWSSASAGTAGAAPGAGVPSGVGSLQSYESHGSGFASSSQPTVSQSGSSSWMGTVLPLVGMAALVAGGLALGGLGGFGGYGGGYGGYPGYGYGYGGYPGMFP